MRRSILHPTTTSALVACLALFVCSSGSAQVIHEYLANRHRLEDYYAIANADDPAALRATLHEIIDDHIRHAYSADVTDTWDILDLASEDPVDDLERHRVDVVWRNQGNRNRFIDHPEWANCIFAGTDCGGTISHDGFESGATRAWAAVVP